MVQREKARLQLELDAVAAELVSREKALAAAKVCLRADDRTIKAVESQADYLKDWLPFSGSSWLSPEMRQRYACCFAGSTGMFIAVFGRIYEQHLLCGVVLANI